MRVFAGGYDGPGGQGVGEILLRQDQRSFKGARWDHSAPDPSYLTVNREGTRLYACCEGPVSFAAAWDISGGGMKYLGKKQASGRDACHVCLSPDERFLYAANYASGSLDVFELTDGGIGERIETIQNHGRGVDPDRQEGPHAHCAAFAPGGQYLCLCDLGLDQIIVYRQDKETGRLTEASRCGMPGGLGVRHIAFRGLTAFACHEMGSAVSRLSYDDGKLTIENTVSLLGDEWRGRSFCAAVRIWEDKVFVSNRGKDTVSVLDTELNIVGEIPTHGHWPRDIWILPGGNLLCANQYSGNLTIVSPEGEKLDEMSAPGVSGLAAAY